MEPYLGAIIPYANNFAIRGWAFCDGQILPISSNSALFSLLGTTFGGDGRTTFALPDLRGRAMKHVGNGAGLEHVSWGQKGGSEFITLTAANLPSHTHTMMAIDVNADSGKPAGRYWARTGSTAGGWRG